MSMTKRYLDSLTQEQQDAILGAILDAEEAGINLDYEAYWDAREADLGRLDEWTDDAENEPMDEELAEWALALIEEDEPIYELKPGLARCKHIMRTSGHQCQLAKGHVGHHAWEESWVNRVALIEEEDEELYDPPVKCRICGKTWPISNMNTNGECPDCQLEDLERRESPTIVSYLKSQIAEAERDIAKGKRVESNNQRLAALKAVLAREEAPLQKPQGKCVTLEDNNGVFWKV